jgi:two-component system cell cycle response regulator DivK
MTPKILVVEDNALHRELLTDLLRATGFEVLEAGDGEEGIRVAREERPDLIVMDMQMPVMDGIRAASILKADPDTRSIKILAVTAFAMKGDRERILMSGVDEYLPKPVNTRELPNIVRRMLGIYEETAGPRP